MKRRNKINNSNMSRAKRLVKGLVVSWESDKPCLNGDLVNPTVSHTNPIMRLSAPTIIRDFGDFITTRQAFLWRVVVTVVFRYPNGTDQLEDRELLAHTVLSRLNEHTFEAIEDAMRHGAKERYVTTRFRVECLGDRAPRESDSLMISEAG